MLRRACQINIRERRSTSCCSEILIVEYGSDSHPATCLLSARPSAVAVTSANTIYILLQQNLVTDSEAITLIVEYGSEKKKEIMLVIMIIVTIIIIMHHHHQHQDFVLSSAAILAYIMYQM